MTWLSILAHWFEFWIRMIRPNVCRLHPSVAVLTICDGISRNVLHPSYFTHTTSRILDEVIPRSQLLNKRQHMLVHFVTMLSFIRLRSKMSVVFSMPVRRYCGDTISSTVRRRPNDVRSTELFQYLLRCNCRDVGVQVDIGVLPIPLY